MPLGIKSQDRFHLPPVVHRLAMVLASLCLLAQACATVAHFHPSAGTLASASIHMAAETGKHHQPAGDDSDNCPLCQSLYSGQYIAPNLVAWFLPILAVSIINVTTGAIPHYDTVSHSWRGRGPPYI